MRPIMVTDRRILSTKTADALAKTKVFKRRPLFIFRGGDKAIAAYVFGYRVYCKGWLV